MVPVAESDVLDDQHITEITGFRPEGSRRQPAKPAELAQARAFETILRTEFVRLTELAARSEHRTPAPDTDAEAKCRDLADIHERVEEVRQLLRALRDRFGAFE